MQFKIASSQLRRSFQFRILRDAISVGMGTVTVYLAAFARDIIVAGTYGRGAAFEAYLIALLLPTIVSSILSSACDASVLPAYVRLSQPGARESRAQYVSSVSWAFLVIGSTLMLLLVLLSPFVGHWLLAPENAAVSYVAPLAILLAPVAIFGSIMPLFVAMLNAARRFWVTSLAPAAVPIAVLIGLLIMLAFGKGGGSGGMWFLGISTLVGTVMQAGLLVSAYSRREKIPIPRWNGFSPEIIRSLRTYAPVLIGSLLMTAGNFIDQAMAASLAPGSLAALSYGGKFVLAVSSAASIAIGTAAFPTFARLLAEHRYTETLSCLRQILTLVALVTVPVAALIFALSRPMIAVLFQRGAFQAEDTAVVAGIQAMYALQVPWNVAGIVVVRMLSALGAGTTILAIGGANLALKILLNLILMRKFGVTGLALSTSLVYCVSFFLCLLFAHGQLKRLGRRR
jgi:putative peptidoglycan lipid II flippase